MTISRLVLAALILLPTIACDGQAKSDDKEPKAAEDEHAEIKKKIVGSWIGQDDSAEIYELTAERFKATYPKIEGGKPMEGPYSIVKVDGDKVTIKPMLELGQGKTFPGDEQIITVVDADTIERTNALSKDGGVFKRKK